MIVKLINKLRKRTIIRIGIKIMNQLLKLGVLMSLKFTPGGLPSMDLNINLKIINNNFNRNCPVQKG